MSMSPIFFIAWATAGIPLGTYNIVDDFNIALQVQPNILILLSLVTWGQCKYYGDHWTLRRLVPCLIAIASVYGGLEVGLVFALRSGRERGVAWPTSLMAILAAVLLAGGVLRHYVDMWRTRSDAGLSLRFALMDAGGDLASLLSVAFQPRLSVLGLVVYGCELVIWLGLIISLLCFRFDVTVKERVEARRAGGRHDVTRVLSGTETNHDLLPRP